ncbi:methyl-accepting chemotaxis protein [Vibrio sp. 10N.286.52.C3]|uniref:methyl-accepting chemotaxis protein n=1 Tax=Vibrio TaxID=662 RepID=UPI000C841AE1|nr:methyl-accepting chemotaxis protein [Vibrio cyclitrophicus]PMH40957.1 chemotaxis protein [Vibrio cyclitrophicus]PMH77452.1 chemotaxis protein [Vibrio cyclitrophicus]
MNEFKVRILGTIGAIIAFIVITLIAIGFMSFKEESIELHRQVLQEKNATIDENLSQKIEGYRSVLSGVKVSKSDMSTNGLSDKAITQLEMLYRTQIQFIEGAYLINIDGSIYNVKGEKQDFNVRDLGRSYYKAVFNEGKVFFFSAPFVSAVTNREVVAMAYKIDGDVAVITTVNLDSLLESIAEREDIFLYTEDGTILVAPYPELRGKNIYQERPLYKGFNTSNRELNYSASVNGDDIAFSAFWTQLEITGWQFVSFIKDATIEKGADNQLVISIIVGVVSLLVALVILLVTVNRLVLKPVGGTPNEIAGLMELMAKGDFTQRVESTGSETGIYQSLIKLSNQLSKLIKNSHGISENVSSASEELNMIMNDTKSNAQEELSQVEQISTAINELSSTSQEVSQQAVAAEEEARKAKENVELGKKTLEENILLTGSIEASVNESAHIVDELRRYAIEIGSVTEVINSISEQTNLLALNAAIEAARASEHGRGFAVVADEVRSLASKTQESTVSIQEIIEKLQKQSERAQCNMAQNVELIEQSVQLADNVKASFEGISTSVESISDINTMVATAAQEQFSVTEDISKNTTLAFDLVQQNVSGIDETLQASSELARLAETQKSELDFFKI